MPGYTFKQYDSRWGKKNYNGSSTMSSAGCGPTACACLIYAINPKITPWDTALYMKKHGYAIRNAGTAWAGIPACLKAFGMKNVKEQSTMNDAFKVMAKGHMAVILFRGGTRGGVTWTTGGHFLAATGYKVENGKHYLYMRDPGGRDHDGWYCYETTMRGLIPAIWTCNFDGEPAPEPTPSYKITVDGSWGKATTKLTQRVLKCSIDGVMGKQSWKAVQKKCGLVGKQVDGIPGPNTYKAMSKFLKIKTQTKKTKTLVRAWQKWLNTQVS